MYCAEAELIHSSTHEGHRLVVSHPNIQDTFVPKAKISSQLNYAWKVFHSRQYSEVAANHDPPSANLHEEHAHEILLLLDARVYNLKIIFGIYTLNKYF